MAHPSAHLATTAVAILLLGALEGAESHGGYRNWRGGRVGSNRWPSAFLSSDLDGGAFRPFQGQARGGGALVDIFQDVLGDITKVARELSAGTSTNTPRHEVLETPDAVIVTVDLPGCKKHDVDAQISEDSAIKTLKITAVRKKSRTADHPSAAGESSASPDSAESSESPATPPFTEESFELSFQIGEGIDVSGVRGKLEDGVLTLVLPRVAPEPPAQPIEIPIDPPAESENHKATRGASKASGGVDSGDKVSVDGSKRSADTHISLS